MKITRRDLGVLMLIAGILIAFLAYKMSFEGTLDEIDTLQNEQNNLKKKIKELEPLEKDSKTWESNTKKMQEALTKLLDEFAPDVWQENNIMYVVDAMENVKVDVSSFSAKEAAEVQRVEGAGSFAGTFYVLAKASVDMTYEVEDYDSLKDLIKFVYKTDKNKRVIEEISMTFDKYEGTIAGTATIFEYVMNDGKRPYTPEKLPDDDLGIESGVIFGETEESTEAEDKD